MIGETDQHGEEAAEKIDQKGEDQGPFSAGIIAQKKGAETAEGQAIGTGGNNPTPGQVGWGSGGMDAKQCLFIYSFICNYSMFLEYFKWLREIFGMVYAPIQTPFWLPRVSDPYKSIK